MGYDIERFSDTIIEEELVCSICKGILEDPLQAPECEHTFCRSCIQQWLKTNSICPQDRLLLTSDILCNVPRIMKNLLAKLEISCDYKNDGCKRVIRLEHLQAHLADCEFNPTRLVKCENGCGFSMPKNETVSHNCVKQLRNYIDNCFDKWEEERKLLIGLAGLSLRKDNHPETISSLNWHRKFPPAKVTRWGALISTPNFELQSIVRQELCEARCPVDLLNELLHNSHERQWPSGLNSLDVRQRSHSSYKNFLLRKIGNHDAVLCLAHENIHMSPDKILDPGFIMIFAHGVEELSEEERPLASSRSFISSIDNNNSDNCRLLTE